MTATHQFGESTTSTDDRRAAAPHARWIFAGAGTYGLVVISSLYLFEHRIGLAAPPAITHPEYYYGFIAVTLTWQLVFLKIGGDPVRLRPLMPLAILEKLGYAATIAVLLALGRIGPSAAAGAVVDLAIMVLFIWAYQRTPRGPEGGPQARRSSLRRT